MHADWTRADPFSQGGHVDTYTNPETGAVHDYGVAVYFPYEDALDFFTEMNVTLAFGFPPTGGPATTSRDIDFATGTAVVPGFRDADPASVFGAVGRFHDLMVARGWDKMTQPGYWNFPTGSDIPSDLLLPIGEFLKKHDIEPMMSRMYPSTSGGVGSRGGDFSAIATLTLLKSFPTAWVKVLTGEVGMYHVEGGNQRLYDNIAALLTKTSSVLYNSTVTATLQRTDSSISLIATNHKDNTKTLIRAKQLLLAVPPTRENLAPFDLSPQEKTHFSKPKYGRSHTGIVSHPALTPGSSLRNIPTPAANSTDPLSQFLKTPYVMSLTSYGSNTELFSLGASGDDYAGFTPEAAQGLVAGTVGRMVERGTIAAEGEGEGGMMKVVAWSDHGPGGFGVSAEDVRGGWMRDMYALQGRRGTWFTGGAVAADFTTTLWKFNDDLLERMVRSS